MRCSPVFRPSFSSKTRPCKIHDVPSRRAGRRRGRKKKEGRKTGGGKDDWRRSREKGGRFKTLEDETANDFHGRIITTPFVFCPGDKSLVDSVSMREVSFPFFLFSS